MFTVCSCCGFESGFDDGATLHPITIEEYRVNWVKKGSPWFSSVNQKPSDFDLTIQFKRIGIVLEDLI